MADDPTLPAIERFGLVMDELYQSVMYGCRPGAFTPEVWRLMLRRVRRLKAVVLAVAAWIAAGMPAEKPRAPVKRAPRPGQTPPGNPYPRAFAWLADKVPMRAAGVAEWLRQVFLDDEMKALVRASPRMRRALRPICHMLGIHAYELDLPKPAPPATAEQLQACMNRLHEQIRQEQIAAAKLPPRPRTWLDPEPDSIALTPLGLCSIRF